MARDQVSAFEKALVDEGIAGTQLEDIARSIHQQESGKGKNTKTSNAGAVGQMQIVPRTFKAYHPTGNIKDPYDNAVGGLRYIKDLATKAGDDIGLVAAGYYGGPKAMAKAKVGEALGDKKNPNAPNTLQYMEQVMSRVKPGEKSATAQGSEKPGFFRSPVPKFIRSEAPNLGTGYNAALALMGMSDEDDPVAKAQETLAQNEEENAVADFGQAQKMLASVQAPNAFAKQQPRMLASGGAVTARPVPKAQTYGTINALPTMGNTVSTSVYGDDGNIYSSPAAAAAAGVGYSVTPKTQSRAYGQRQPTQQEADQAQLDTQMTIDTTPQESTGIANIFNNMPGRPLLPSDVFAQQQPQKFMANGGEVRHMAGGGFMVPFQTNILRQPDKAYLDESQQMWDQYNTKATNYNQALDKYNTEIYNPYKSQVDEYNTALSAFQSSDEYKNYNSAADAYNAKVEAYNAAPLRTVAEQVYYGGAPGGPGYLGNRYVYYRASGPGQEQAFQTGYQFVNTNPAVPYFGNIYTKDAADPGKFTLTAPTFGRAEPAAPTPFGQTAPATPERTQEQILAYQKEALGRAQKDAQGRGLAIEVVNNPDQYNLAGFGSAGINAPSMFAKGGEAKKSEESEHDKQASKFFDELSTYGQDITVSPKFSVAPSYTNEPGVGYQAVPTTVQGAIEAQMPLWGGQAKAAVSGTAVKPQNQRLITMPGDVSLGYSTQQGPHAVSFEARRSINPMPTPGGGRGHMYGANINYKYQYADGGEVAPEPEKSSAKAMLKEVGRSTQYLPADIAGSPVDLINLGLKGVDAMTGSKLAQNMPVGGSEWIIKKANEYGLMDKPTGSTTETVTRFATGLASPGAVVKGAAMAGGKAATMSRKALDEAYELSGMSRAKKAASAAEEAPVVAPKAAPAPVVEQAPKSQSRSMLDEIDPEIQKLITEPRVKGFEGPKQPKRTLTTPSADRPFISPLDKFFAQGNNPVTVEQLTNQLAKGSRDYEMNRVAKLLEGKSPKDKVRPADLLKQLEETSPSRFRVEIKEPDPKNMGQFHASMENPFPSKPMGTVNLLEDVTPQEKLAQSYLEDMQYKQLYRYKGASSYSQQEKDTAAKQLEVFFGSPMAKEIVGNNLTSSFKRDVPEIRKLRSHIDEIRNDMNDISYPSQASKYGFDYFKESQKLQKEAYEKYPEIKSISDVDERVKKLSAVVDPVVKNNAENAILAGLDKKYGTNLLAHRESLGNDWDKLSGYEKSKITERMLGDLVGGDLTKSIKRFEELEKPYRDAVAKALSQNEIYKGQHFSIAKEKPISFSRFQDVTLPTKENVMVIPELQSDRYDDLLKKGSKSGSQYKDSDELAQLDQDLNSVTRKIYKAQDATTRDQLKLESTKIEQRMANLRERLQAGDYSTPEFTPGIERMPQVMQQIMLKNAVHAGIQRGKNGVLFPGSDSAQAQLYEKLPNNIRSVLKDLGPGFEMRKVPLQYENGSTIDRYGIFWKDDAAQRISKEGVRFKKGGMVDKNDDENQKYI